jgi:hypothetical protein
MAEPGRLVTRAEPETHVYGATRDVNRNRLDVHILPVILALLE